MLFRKV